MKKKILTVFGILTIFVTVVMIALDVLKNMKTNNSEEDLGVGA